MNKRIIEIIKETLHQHLPVGGRALLFGSQARGDAHVRHPPHLAVMHQLLDQMMARSDKMMLVEEAADQGHRRRYGAALHFVKG